MIGNIDIFENFLSIEECTYILNKYTNELELKTAQVANNDSKSRKSSVGWIDDLGEINERLKTILKSNFDFNGGEVTGLGPFQFTEYNVGEFYDWHTDKDLNTFKERMVSTVIQLNDNYEGGLLEIKNPKEILIPINQKMGNLYIFNSGLKHRVTPVIDGIRYSLVNWVSFVKTDSKKQNLL